VSPAPGRMRAAYVTAHGPPSEIKIGDLPVPAIGPADVLVAVEVVAVSAADTFVRSGRYATPVPFPYILGRDLAGRVVAAGQCAPFAEGDRVWASSLGHEGRQGCFAQFAVVPADRLYPLPDAVRPELAVALAHPAATAWLGWFAHARLRAGETVYVGGAAGNVGSAALAMARHAGARVLAGARPADHDRCRAAGAAEVADYADPDLAGVLRGLAPDGVDVFWDTSGRQDLELAAAVLRPGGRIVVSAGFGGRTEVPLGALYTRDVSLLGFVMSRARADHLAAAAALINDLAAAGRLTARIAGELPLSDAAEAHARMEAGQIHGRLLLRP
jgi:2-desacetyl-2-hydroxyethyl bacteriochlorophyllide A dehydrogenase